MSTFSRHKGVLPSRGQRTSMHIWENDCGHLMLGEGLILNLVCLLYRNGQVGRVQDSTLWWYRGGISSAWWVTSTAEWWRRNKAKPRSAVMASSHQRLGANMACLQASAVTHWKWLATQHLTPRRVITPGRRGRPVLSRLHFLHLSPTRKDPKTLRWPRLSPKHPT